MENYAHIPLKRLEGELQRRKRRGFGGVPDRDHDVHGPKLADEVASVLDDHAAKPTLDGVDPSLILRVEIAGFVDESIWQKLGLIVLSEDNDKTLLLFATDQELREFRARIEAYLGDIPEGQKGHSYAGLIEAIESVGLATPVDRIGTTLTLVGVSAPADFVDTQTYLLDVELFHPSEDMQAKIFIFRLETTVKAYGGSILNTYIGDNLLLSRVEASGAAFKEILKLTEVASIERPPEPDLQLDDIAGVTADAIAAGAPPLADGVPIGIIDSGVNSGHPLLAYAMRGSFASHPSLTDADEVGHGTSVASVAAYGDILKRVAGNNFDAPFWLGSARVVDAVGEFPKDVTVPELMQDAIRKLNHDFGCRIVNISLGDRNQVYGGGKAGIWAATLDEIARELDILIVVSTGNQSGSAGLGEKILDEYPGYLLEAASGLLDPATAVNVLTVGSLAHCNGLEDEDADYVGVRPICDADQPSPFTRAGPGVRGMIKPDLVDYGGNLVWDGPTKSVIGGPLKSSAGVWTFHHKPIDRLFKARSGTSFAAPIVAHKAALLLAENPGASSNHLRSMLALSSEIPAASHDVLAGFDKYAPLMICGNGMANVGHALNSEESRVIFFTDDELSLDSFAVYELPIPEIFQTTNGTREIAVSLAFDPPTRRSRADYLGVTMGWRLIRGSSEKDVFDKFRVWEAAEGDPPEFPPRNDCTTFPGSQLREKGTLQRASFTAKTNMSEYGDRYYVAAWCRRRWAPEEIRTQRFSLAAQLRHSADIQLYQAVTVPVKLMA